MRRSPIGIRASSFPPAIALAFGVLSSGTSSGAPAAPAPGAAPAAHPQHGLLVAGTSRCRVGLTKVSYDDPGADDSELIELFVDPVNAPARNAPSWSSGPSGAAGPLTDAGVSTAPAACSGSHPTTPVDAGADSEASPAGGDAEAPLTLSACGLSTLELVDGASDACQTYRSIPLGDVAVPDDRYIVICAGGSSLAAAGRCDVTHAGRSALSNGWLQNGPSDGLRFVDPTHRIAVEVAYEGRPACFAKGATLLADETGVLTGANGAPEDDINVFCGGNFVLLGARDAPLRAENQCPVGGAAAFGGEGASDPLVPNDAGAGPAPRPSASTTGAPDPFDAGPVVVARRAVPPPAPPGCAIGRPARPGRAGPLVPLLLTASGIYRAFMRRKRRRIGIREQSSDRSGSSLPR